VLTIREEAWTPNVNHRLNQAGNGRMIFVPIWGALEKLNVVLHCIHVSVIFKIIIIMLCFLASTIYAQGNFLNYFTDLFGRVSDRKMLVFGKNSDDVIGFSSFLIVASTDFAQNLMEQGMNGFAGPVVAGTVFVFGGVPYIVDDVKEGKYVRAVGRTITEVASIGAGIVAGSKCAPGGLLASGICATAAYQITKGASTIGCKIAVSTVNGVFSSDVDLNDVCWFWYTAPK